ncbi:hypothetical protein [Acetobacter thailandicus]|uniref:hypothetical protein n=1 Tax=Acetobacter thailandicus TaxID=1502842 RepID=UPI001BA66A14|nr:hypothetical protein [Acetobacter thailandicus]MBS0980664.1 hypothetical protein [Acetobacter thailandicus]
MDRTYFDPYQYYPGKHLTITLRQLLLTDFGCEVESVTHSTGRFKKVFTDGVSGPPYTDYDGLPKFPEKVTYGKVQCSHRLVIFKDDDSQSVSREHIEKSIPVKWNIIVHSHTEIDLPFYYGAYLHLRKVTPATS